MYTLFVTIFFFLFPISAYFIVLHPIGRLSFGAFWGIDFWKIQNSLTDLQTDNQMGESL